MVESKGVASQALGSSATSLYNALLKRLPIRLFLGEGV
jgi:hypothetical protein